MKPIYTVRDAIRDAELEELNREYKIKKAFLTKKVKHWQKMVDKFGGEIHQITLDKFKKQLTEI
jgi:hypothetical protein